MERLTQRLDYNYEYEYGSIGIACDDEQYLEKVYNKLGQLEDIEEELGIDLITLFKALKEGIYCVDFDNQDVRKFKAPLCFNSTSNQFYWYGSNIGYPDLKDYGKTYALTKEELENE